MWISGTKQIELNSNISITNEYKAYAELTSWVEYYTDTTIWKWGQDSPEDNTLSYYKIIPNQDTNLTYTPASTWCPVLETNYSEIHKQVNIFNVCYLSMALL
jgi:hypothetical protein